MLDVPFHYRIINVACSYLSIVTEHDKIKMSEIDNCLIDVYIVNDHGSIIVDEKIDICYLSSVE